MAKRGRKPSTIKKSNSHLPKYKKRQEEYHANVPDADRNPNHETDFEQVLKGLIELPPEEQKDELD